MIRYHHRQLGTLVLIVGGLSIGLLAALLYFLGAYPVGVAVLILLVVVFSLCPTLTVEVTDADIVVKFGPGLVRRRFPLSGVRGARAVRNQWYYGWGIRMLPKGLLYNVSGLDAVEIEMADGGVHRIGTDEPAALLKAIQGARVTGVKA